jgi:hypothetical protein
MAKQAVMDRGITIDVSKFPPAVTVELFGHVILFRACVGLCFIASTNGYMRSG